MDTEWLNVLRSGCVALGVGMDERQIQQCGRFCQMLYDWNTRLNLTRIPAPEANELHILDSLSIGAAVDMSRGGLGLDIGTGAGVPGIPLCIAWPSWRFVLADGTAKKLRFVDAALTELQLTNAETVHARAEDLARNRAMQGRFDLVVARAVAPMKKLAKWMLPFVRAGGRAVAYKSGDAMDEIRDAEPGIRDSGGTVSSVVRVRLPISGAERALAVIARGNARTLQSRRHA